MFGFFRVRCYFLRVKFYRLCSSLGEGFWGGWGIRRGGDIYFLIKVEMLNRKREKKIILF